MLELTETAACESESPRPPMMEPSPLSAISKLPFLLTWKLFGTFPNRVREEYYRLLGSAFDSWLTCYPSSGPARKDISDLYLSLPIPSRLRFLTAPDIGTALLNQEAEEFGDGSFFNDCLQAEAVRLKQPVRNRKPLWTALRDHYYPSAGATFELPAPYGKSGIVPFQASRAEEIIIDAYSPAAMADLPGLPLQRTEYSEIEYHSAVEHVIKGLRSISTVSPKALQLIRSVLKVIIVRRDTAHPKSCTSSSWPMVIGKIALTNVDVAAMDEGWIANAVLHESIHSFLYSVELSEPFFCSLEARTLHQTISPWSGRMLQLHSFVHACFVWFGLWCFWNLPATEAFSPRAVNRCRQAAASGFYATDLLDHLGSEKNLLVEPIIQAIRTIQEMVRENYALT